MFISTRISTSVRQLSATMAIILGLAMASQASLAADQCTSSNGTTSSAALAIGVSGASTASQLINAVLVTEGQIGAMADRILWTETQIGAMSNRIVYVTQFSQNNSILAYYAFMNPVYLGQSNGHYQYSGTLVQVPSLPFGW